MKTLLILAAAYLGYRYYEAHARGGSCGGSCGCGGTCGASAAPVSPTTPAAVLSPYAPVFSNSGPVPVVPPVTSLPVSTSSAPGQLQIMPRPIPIVRPTATPTQIKYASGAVRFMALRAAGL